MGSDERNEKSTYVTLTSLDEARNLARQTVDEALAALALFGNEAEFLREIVRMLMAREK